MKPKPKWEKPIFTKEKSEIEGMLVFKVKNLTPGYVRVLRLKSLVNLISLDYPPCPN